MKDHLLFKAMNSSSLDRCNNYQPLETLGDTVLKTLTTINLYMNTNDGPDKMTDKRKNEINNSHLERCARSNSIMYFQKSQYLVMKEFIPPFFVQAAVSKAEQNVDDQNQEAREEINYAETQVISGKMMADGLEAILGMFLG